MYVYVYITFFDDLRTERRVNEYVRADYYLMAFELCVCVCVCVYVYIHNFLEDMTGIQNKNCKSLRRLCFCMAAFRIVCLQTLHIHTYMHTYIYAHIYIHALTG